MYTVFLLLHVIIAGSLIALVLLQQGKGAEAGAAFGSGASATVFGSRGSASFLSRITAGLATGFFLTSLILAYFATQGREPTSVIDRAPISTEAPADSGVPAPTDVPTGVPTDVPAPEPQSAAPAGDGTDVPQPPDSGN